MVFEQDSIVCVGEKSGDIIYAYEFEKFHRMEKYLCWAAEFLQRIWEAVCQVSVPVAAIPSGQIRYRTDAGCLFFCMDSNLCSANTVRDYMEHKVVEKARERPFVYPSQIPVNDLSTISLP